MLGDLEYKYNVKLKAYQVKMFLHVLVTISTQVLFRKAASHLNSEES